MLLFAKHAENFAPLCECPIPTCSKIRPQVLPQDTLNRFQEFGGFDDECKSSVTQVCIKKESIVRQQV